MNTPTNSPSACVLFYRQIDPDILLVYHGPSDRWRTVHNVHSMENPVDPDDYDMPAFVVRTALGFPNFRAGTRAAKHRQAKALGNEVFFAVPLRLCFLPNSEHLDYQYLLAVEDQP